MSPVNRLAAFSRLRLSSNPRRKIGQRERTCKANSRIMLLLETLFAPTMTRKGRKEDGRIVAKSSRLSEVDGRKGSVRGQEDGS